VVAVLVEAELDAVARVLDVGLVHELIEVGTAEELCGDCDELRRATETPEQRLGPAAPDDTFDANASRVDSLHDEERPVDETRFVEGACPPLETRKSALKALDGPLSEGPRKNEIALVGELAALRGRERHSVQA
jgi:hypothetical protein